MSSGVPTGISSGRALLAIELSQRRGSIALRGKPGAEIVSAPVEPSTNDRDMLMPAIDQIVKDAGLVPADIGVVALSVGPGGFTGLRVAVSTAKALSLGLGAALVAVPSALVVARTLVDSGLLKDGSCGVVLAAKGESAWLDRIQIKQGEVQSLESGLFAAADAPIAGLMALVSDEHLPASWASAAAALGIPRVSAAWDARACLVLGEAILAAVGPTDPLKIEPIYPRQAEAVTLWEGRSSGTARKT